MTERVVEVAETPARVSLSLGRLVVEQSGRAPLSLPVGEVAVLVLAHPQISLSQPILAALSEAGAAVIACDDRRLPVGMMLPLRAHSTQGERMMKQAAASLPTRKRIWKQIVQAKVRAQARALFALRNTDAGLMALAERVRSGDPANIEAQAAVRYWKLIFGRSGFRRSPDAEDENRFLNYGYTILRGMVARAVCAAGLHPSLGVHHHNRYSAYRLADDLMEPYRPVVDRAAVALASEVGPKAPMTSSVKGALVAALMDRYEVQGEFWALPELVQRSAFALAKVLTGRRRDFEIAAP